MKHDKPKRPVPALPFLVAEAEGGEGPDESGGADDHDEAFAEALEPTLPEAKESDKAAIREQLALATAQREADRSRAMTEPAGRTSSAPVGLSPQSKAWDAGPFRLVSRLAVGGMSEVWLADALQGTLAGRTVVLKRLLPTLRGTPDCVERFRAEARFGAALVHPNLARTFELYERPPELFLSQELLGGETLGLLTAAARKKGERLHPGAVLHAIDSLLTALSFLHTGGHGQSELRLIHGDVNPDNLVARPDGQVKLIDLGLAQPLGPTGVVTSPDGALRGTPAYMAPEQVKARPLSPKSDLFSAGVLLWELLANRPLFADESQFETLRRVRELPAPPLRSVWPEAPTSFERLLVRALAKDEAQRFESAEEFAAALRQAGHREGMSASPELLAAEVARHAPKAPRADPQGPL
ncbi:MAG: serine/threonine protein kinase [Deltaproteobacteria bacterium]|nr:serine/threonine protein kinase [Deltaproteobacteria bacterium]